MEETLTNQTNIDKPFPITSLKTLGGGEVTIGKPRDGRWQLVVVYRGLHVSEVSSASFCRPDLEFLKMGVSYVVEKRYPPRGTG